MGFKRLVRRRRATAEIATADAFQAEPMMSTEQESEEVTTAAAAMAVDCKMAEDLRVGETGTEAEESEEEDPVEEELVADEANAADGLYWPGRRCFPVAHSWRGGAAALSRTAAAVALIPDGGGGWFIIWQGQAGAMQIETKPSMRLIKSPSRRQGFTLSLQFWRWRRAALPRPLDGGASGGVRDGVVFPDGMRASSGHPYLHGEMCRSLSLSRRRQQLFRSSRRWRRVFLVLHEGSAWLTGPKQIGGVEIQICRFNYDLEDRFEHLVGRASMPMDKEGKILFRPRVIVLHDGFSRHTGDLVFEVQLLL